MSIEYNTKVVQQNVASALAEDVGQGDVTADLLSENQRARATVFSREAAIIAGRPWFDEVFRQLDESVEIRWRVEEGGKAIPDQELCSLEGPVQSLLTGERTALNFLQTLSGTATMVEQYVSAVSGTGAKILDTRKTIPGLRHAQKYAVLCGGGQNHRIGLFDEILIKENHIESSGSISQAVLKAKQLHPDLPFEVEVENLVQLEEALSSGAKRILLDNMDLSLLKRAVKTNHGLAKLEASGNITLENILGVAQTGVDYISIGGLTKHVRAIDLSMRLQSQNS